MSDDLIPNLRVHRDELTGALQGVRRDAAGRKLRRFPSRWLPLVWSRLKGPSALHDGSTEGWCSVGHCIRQIHDFYGWMAKHGTRGTCAGTLYRSAKFMTIDARDRNGTKGRERNVHIEHTVPVRVLEKALAFHIDEFETLADLHWFLLRHSICVALHHGEQEQLPGAGVPRDENDAFDDSGRPVHDHPFRRYRSLSQFLKAKDSDFRVFNVVNGAEVDLESFTFDDHVATLEAATRLVTGGHQTSLYGFELFDAHTSPSCSRVG